MNKNNKMSITLMAICLIGLIGIGVSYSYYLASLNIENLDNAESSLTTNGTTNIIMDISDKEISSNGALPGHKGVKDFTIRGEGLENAMPSEASIKITPNLGVFSDDVTWKLYKSDEEITCTSKEINLNNQYYEEGTCNIPTTAVLELSGGASEAYQKIIVYPNTLTKYYLVVEYANSENQNNQQGKSFLLVLI